MNEENEGAVFIKIGPCGSMSHHEWDDGCFDGVAEIFIWHGAVISAIQFVYNSCGRLILSDKHGDNASKFDAIQLEYPSEYLTGLCGQTTRDNITSLMFFSNKRKFGPFGDWQDDKEPDFHMKVMDNKIKGFFGHVDAYYGYLSSIGIHLRALPPNIDG